MKLPQRLLILSLIVLTMFSAAGCSLLSNARISGMMPGMSDLMDKLECWLNIEFTRYPKGANRRDEAVNSSFTLTTLNCMPVRPLRTRPKHSLRMPDARDFMLS